MESRRVINGSRSTPPPKLTKEPEPSKEEPPVSPPPRRESVSSRRGDFYPPEAPRRRWFGRPPIFAGIGLLLIVGVLAWVFFRPVPTAIDGGRYQAVCFADGQCYFGKLSPLNDQFMKLTDVYYLKTQTQTDASEGVKNPANQNDVQLVKLGTGNEIHDPEDTMLIAKAQMLYYENLKIDSRVAQAIERHKKTSEAN